MVKQFKYYCKMLYNLVKHRTVNNVIKTLKKYRRY